MLCNNCHSSNAPGARFCAVCGAALQDDYPQEYRPQHQRQENEYDYAQNAQQSYGYDDGFSVKRGDSEQSRRKDYEYYPDNNQVYSGYQGGYNQYQYQQYGNQYGFQQLQKSRPTAGAIVMYMLSGVLALVTMLMTVLPSLDAVKMLSKYSSQYASGISNSDRYRNVFQWANEYLSYTGSGKTDHQVTGVIILLMFTVPMIFLLLWAIFSFCRSRAAGVMGLIGSIGFLSAAGYWLLYLYNEVSIGKYYMTGETSREAGKMLEMYGGIRLSDAITAVPYLMVALAVAGIVFSAVQLALRSRVR